MQVTLVWVRVALVGEHSAVGCTAGQKSFQEERSGMKQGGCHRDLGPAWRRWLRFGAHQNKNHLFYLKSTFQRKKKKNLAYLDPSLKVDPVILTRITNVLCALTGFVSYNIVRVYTCTKYNLIEMLRKNGNKKSQMIYSDFFIKV